MNILQQIEDSELSPRTKRTVSNLFKLLAMHAKDMNGRQLFEARTAAGLSLGQVAAITGLSATHLAACETDCARLTTLQAAAIDSAYGLGVDLG